MYIIDDIGSIEFFIRSKHKIDQFLEIEKMDKFVALSWMQYELIDGFASISFYYFLEDRILKITIQTTGINYDCFFIKDIIKVTYNEGLKSKNELIISFGFEKLILCNEGINSYGENFEERLIMAYKAYSF